MSIFQHITNFIKSPIYELTPEDETRIVLDNFEKRAEKQIEFMLDKTNRYYTSQNNGHINDGYKTKDDEAITNFITHNGREKFAEIYTYRKRRCYIKRTKALYQQYITLNLHRIKNKLKTIQHFHKKAHSN